MGLRPKLRYTLTWVSGGGVTRNFYRPVGVAEPCPDHLWTPRVSVNVTDSVLRFRTETRDLHDARPESEYTDRAFDARNDGFEVKTTQTLSYKRSDSTGTSKIPHPTFTPNTRYERTDEVLCH